MTDDTTQKETLYELALFAGAGGGILGGILLDHITVCAVEIDPYRRCILIQRQNEGNLPAFPVWDDIRDFAPEPWRGTIDLVSGGFPCQDISTAGKQLGINGPRSGLWKHMARIIRAIRPRYALMENSPNLINCGLGQLLADLAALRYNALWSVFRASSHGFPHFRARIFILAHTKRSRWPRTIRRHPPKLQKTSQRRTHKLEGALDPRSHIFDQFTQSVGEPPIFRMDDGMAHRMVQLKAAGVGQVPLVVKHAWETLKGLLT